MTKSFETVPPSDNGTSVFCNEDIIHHHREPGYCFLIVKFLYFEDLQFRERHLAVYLSVLEQGHRLAACSRLNGLPLSLLRPYSGIGTASSDKLSPAVYCYQPVVVERDRVSYTIPYYNYSQSTRDSLFVYSSNHAST